MLPLHSKKRFLLNLFLDHPACFHVGLKLPNQRVMLFKSQTQGMESVFVRILCHHDQTKDELLRLLHRVLIGFAGEDLAGLISP